MAIWGIKQGNFLQFKSRQNLNRNCMNITFPCCITTPIARVHSVMSSSTLFSFYHLFAGNRYQVSDHLKLLESWYSKYIWVTAPLKMFDWMTRSPNCTGRKQSLSRTYRHKIFILFFLYALAVPSCWNFMYWSPYRLISSRNNFLSLCHCIFHPNTKVRKAQTFTKQVWPDKQYTEPV